MTTAKIKHPRAQLPRGRPVPMQFELPADLHRRLKMTAVSRGESMKSLLLALLEIHLPMREFTDHE